MPADTNAALAALHEFFRAVSAEWAAPGCSQRAAASMDAHDKVTALLGEGGILPDAIDRFRVPDAVSPDVAQLWDLALAAPRGRWLYRPEPFDDWGVIRRSEDAEGRRLIVGTVRTPPASELEQAEHRAAKTDPYGPAARFVAAANPDAILALLARHAAFMALLVDAAITFRFYEQDHRAKGPGHEMKAQRNADIARRIEEALGIQGEIEAAVATEASLDGGSGARKAHLAERLRCAMVTMINDDFSEPQTQKRSRLMERIATMEAAILMLGGDEHVFRGAAPDLDAGEHEHIRRQERQEIADGALGDGPARRGAARRALASAPVAAAEARPLEEWHEGIGDVLWWRFPIEEPPYCGSPLDLGYVVETRWHGGLVSTGHVAGWPGYHTHWTPIPMPSEPAAPAAPEGEP